MARISIILISLTLVIAGCDMPVEDERTLVPTEQTTPTSEPESEIVSIEGTFDVVTKFDVTLDGLLPEQALSAVSVLEDFRDEPASTMFELLDDAGVPVVGDLMDALPGVLEGKLMGWMNEYIEDASFQNTPVLDIVDDVLTVSRTSLTNFDMVSELQLDALDADGAVTVNHRIRGFRFPALGLEQTVPVPSLGPLTDTQATAWVERAEGNADAHLVVGEHDFGVPYGQYAFAAVDMFVQERYGMNIRDSLGAAIDCSTFAATVADQCVLGVCVGHEDALGGICERGLDLVVSELQSKFDAYRFDAIELAGGEAEMWDLMDSADDADGRVDRLQGGLWRARLDLGMGLRDIAATFEGQRR